MRIVALTLIKSRGLENYQPEHNTAPKVLERLITYGRVFSDESREKMSLARKKYLIENINPRAKINIDIANEIRSEYSSGRTGKQLAAKHGVSPTTINDIIKGKTWNKR